MLDDNTDVGGGGGGGCDIHSNSDSNRSTQITTKT